MRRYNRWWSRFDQPDPYGGSYNAADPQSLNRYSYVQNDPVNFVDPSGLDSCSIDPATGQMFCIPDFIEDGGTVIGNIGGIGRGGMFGGDGGNAFLAEVGIGTERGGGITTEFGGGITTGLGGRNSRP